MVEILFSGSLGRQFIFSPIFCSVCETTAALQRLKWEKEKPENLLIFRQLNLNKVEIISGIHLVLDISTLISSRFKQF